MQQRAQRNGQAMVEFIVALVSIVVLAAGLLQLTSLMLAQSRTMVEARGDAGEAAVQPAAALSDPEFIKDWENGYDMVPYTVDDEVIESAAESSFRNLFVERAAPSTGWDFVEQSPSDRISTMRTLLSPATQFGLVDGSAAETVALMPAVRSLLYDAESITLRSKVYMTFCGGLY